MERGQDYLSVLKLSWSHTIKRDKTLAYLILKLSLSHTLNELKKIHMHLISISSYSLLYSGIVAFLQEDKKVTRTKEWIFEEIVGMLLLIPEVCLACKLKTHFHRTEKLGACLVAIFQTCHWKQRGQTPFINGNKNHMFQHLRHLL